MKLSEAKARRDEIILKRALEIDAALLAGA